MLFWNKSNAAPSSITRMNRKTVYEDWMRGCPLQRSLERIKKYGLHFHNRHWFEIEVKPLKFIKLIFVYLSKIIYWLKKSFKFSYKAIWLCLTFCLFDDPKIRIKNIKDIIKRQNKISKIVITSKFWDICLICLNSVFLVFQSNSWH